jgi:hypothetical protein
MVVKSYTTCARERIARFDFVNIGGKERRLLDDMTDDEIKQFVESLTDSSVDIEAEGPCGFYAGIENCGLFEEMASVAPMGWIKGEISGYTNDGNQRMTAELKDGKLYLVYECYGNASYEEYEDYIIEKLPYEDFIKLFDVDSLKFDKNMYKEFVDECYQQFNHYLKYEEFIERCTYSAIKKTEYSKSIRKIKKLNIMSYDEFSLIRGESVYDPIEKKYLKDGRIFGDNPVGFNLLHDC